MTTEEMIKNYQCSGCVGSEFPDCYETEGEDIGCSKHCAGTTFSDIGRVFLGLPKGFTRLGACE